MSETADRVMNILVITRRLVILAIVIMLIIATFISIVYYNEERLMLTWFTFGCGIIGGFVSIKQRLNKIDNIELSILANSWFSIILIPVYGGIFSLLLYIIFLSGLIQGSLFPEFFMPEFHDTPINEDIRNLLSN
jgi:hypothetical protein